MMLFKQQNISYFICIVVSLIFSSAITAYSAGSFESGDEEGRNLRWEQGILEIHQQLGLTNEQDRQLKDHRDMHRLRMDTLRKEIREKRDQIGEELQKTNLDMRKVEQIHGELKSLKAGMEDDRLNGILEVRRILTPEQFRRFMKLKKEQISNKRQKIH